jgi:hypothetical protein
MFKLLIGVLFDSALSAVLTSVYHLPGKYDYIHLYSYNNL